MLSDLSGKTCILTGGTGVIGSEIARSLALNGVQMVVLGRNQQRAKTLCEEIENQGGKALPISCDVLDRKGLEEARKEILDRFGSYQFLINAAGGNSPRATAPKEFIDSDMTDLTDTFFDLDVEGFDEVFDLNFKGTLLPSLVFGQHLIEQKVGVVLNVSSMNAFRPLTRIPAYSAAKAAINNFTEWLAVHFARTGVRVNAIAPGFLLTDQNRFLLTDQSSGSLTPRGQKIINNTPMGRFGKPEDLVEAVNFLLSPSSAFITGVVLPVDGGFNAYSGV